MTQCIGFGRLGLFLWVSVIAGLLSSSEATAQTRPVRLGSRVSERAALAPATAPMRSLASSGDSAESSWWAPEQQRFGIGYEASGGYSAFGQNAIVFTQWFNPVIAYDIFLGYTKTADTYTEATSTNDDIIANTRTVTTTFSGDKNRHLFILGGGIRYLLVQNNWFQLTAGGIAGFVFPSSSTYPVGTKTETYQSLTTPGNRSVSDGMAPKIVSQDLAFTVGPKITTEFYLKWFPHLGIGMSTGIATTIGGNITTTTSTSSSVYNVINGVNQAPVTQTNNTQVSVAKLGLRGQTFGFGGTIFNFFGNFTIRYVW